MLFAFPFVCTGSVPTATGPEQFRTLHQHFARMGAPTKALLLSTYAKLLNLYPELKPAIESVMTSNSQVLDAEVQQRAVEYMALPNIPTAVRDVDDTHRSHGQE